MAWISTTSLDDKTVNLQVHLIAAILDRVPGSPRDGSEVILSSGRVLEVVESPAQLLRAIENEERPESPAVGPDDAW